MAPPEREELPAVAGRSHWVPVLLVLVGLAFGARVLLPIWLAPQLAERASTVIGDSVSVGDVDLALWRGGITARDVAIGGVRLAAVSVELDLLALVSGELRLRRLGIDGLDAELIQAPDGLFPELQSSLLADAAVAEESGSFEIAIPQFALTRARIRGIEADTRRQFAEALKTPLER